MIRGSDKTDKRPPQAKNAQYNGNKAEDLRDQDPLAYISLVHSRESSYRREEKEKG